MRSTSSARRDGRILLLIVSALTRINLWGSDRDFVWRWRITGACGLRNEAGTRLPGSRGVSGCSWKRLSGFTRGDRISEIAWDLRITPRSLLLGE